jgi:hypothetical protein
LIAVFRLRARFYSRHIMMNTTIGGEAVVHMILDFKEAYQARATA